MLLSLIMFLLSCVQSVFICHISPSLSLVLSHFPILTVFLISFPLFPSILTFIWSLTLTVALSLPFFLCLSSLSNYLSFLSHLCLLASLMSQFFICLPLFLFRFSCSSFSVPPMFHSSSLFLSFPFSLSLSLSLSHPHTTFLYFLLQFYSCSLFADFHPVRPHTQ
jgi:hypothetical protein